MDKKCLNSIDSVHGELPPPRFAQREHRATNRDRARIEIAHAAVLDVGSREERDNAIIAEGAEDFCAAGHWMRRAGERTERRVANFVGSEITGRRIFFLFLPPSPLPKQSAERAVRGVTRYAAERGRAIVENFASDSATRGGEGGRDRFSLSEVLHCVCPLAVDNLVRDGEGCGTPRAKVLIACDD